MPRVSDKSFIKSVEGSGSAWGLYLSRLTELAVSMFEWKNMPDTIDTRYLELSLYSHGSAIFFNDDVIGYLGLSAITTGPKDCYGEPVTRTAYSMYNGMGATQYQYMNLNRDNSVMCWNNMLRTNTYPFMVYYAKRIYKLDQIIDINANAQKTPILIQADEKQRLTMLNLYKQWDGNEPVIFGDKSLNINGLTVLQTEAPYVGDQLYALKTAIWNEALTYLGISNVNYQKKERLVSDEVSRNEGGTLASRYSRLTQREKFCDKVNKMFGLNISVEYKEDIDEAALMPEKEPDINE